MEAPNDNVAEERPPDSPSSSSPPSKRVIPAQRYRKGDPLPESVSGAPNERKLVELMEKTGCMITQTNGQRRFGPPPDWPPDEPPPRGCEVFIGKIPRDLYEDELVPVLQMMGRLYELRLMMDFYGNNRGYAFAVFASREEAKQCVRALDNYDIRRGRSLGVCISVDNRRLFIGGIPKKVTKADILDEMRRLTDGVVDTIVYASVADKTKNRGFAFVEYENHRAAAMARRKLMRQRLVVWGIEITVNWAEPESPMIDEDVMEKVKFHAECRRGCMGYYYPVPVLSILQIRMRVFPGELEVCLPLCAFSSFSFLGQSALRSESHGVDDRRADLSEVRRIRQAGESEKDLRLRFRSLFFA